MSAYPVLSSAAPGRSFILFPRGSGELLAQLGATSKLAAIVPASCLHVRPTPEMVSSGIPELDALAGGLPRGGLTEICGAASSGRTSVLLAALAEATKRGEVCVLVDASDALHPASAVAAGIEMKQLLWVRCGKTVPSSQFSVASVRTCSQQESSQPNSNEVAIRAEGRYWRGRLEQVLKVTDLLLQSNGFGMIALDLRDVPVCSARRIPLASWFRFRRAVEHTPTVLLVLEQQPIAGSCSSLLVKVSGEKLSALSSQLSGNRPSHTELLDEFKITAELLRSRLERKSPQSAVSFASRAAWAG